MDQVRVRDVGTGGASEAHASGVTWSAVIAGAFATAALALILLALGAGLGVSSVSPWSNLSSSAKAVGTGAIIWLIVAEILSSSLGGYLAGRLRTKWAGIHNDEVYFRDTAHGFLAWCVALVISAAFLASAATALAGAPAQNAPAANNSGATATESYFVDTMFRTATAKPESAGTATLDEVRTIFVRGLGAGALSNSDQTYLAQLVASKTGLPQGEANARVTTAFADAQQAAETARKAVAHGLIWMFIALLCGAFFASLSATIGGHQRDNVVLL